ncbi:FAD linked oxidase, partial [Helicosporidium sp. ATCC 50920]
MRELTHPETPIQGRSPSACDAAGCADSTPGHVHLPGLEVPSTSLDARPSPVPASILRACRFLSNAQGADVFWELRRGLIPLVGANREKGTTSLLEDVACPVPRLASMTEQVTRMLREGGYADAYAFGHALEGNLHLAFSQGMRSAREVERFERTMESLASIVLDHDGSLKAEHGTGRNMAPFVGAEWGPEALEVMWRIKHLFDPGAVLNPGVVLSRDPLAHVRKLKPCPPVHQLVDRCIECGFCESNCPSRDLSLTPRQRIVSLREMRRLEGIASLSPA